jgi:hypothetical protein
LKQSSFDESELDLENVDEYFFSEDCNDLIANKILKKSQKNYQIDVNSENKVN